MVGVAALMAATSCSTSSDVSSVEANRTDDRPGATTDRRRRTPDRRTANRSTPARSTGAPATTPARRRRRARVLDARRPARPRRPRRRDDRHRARPGARRPTPTSASDRSCSTRAGPADRGSISCRRRRCSFPPRLAERFDLVGVRPARRRRQHRRRLRHRDRRQHRAARSGRRRRVERPARGSQRSRRHLPGRGARPGPVRRDQQRGQGSRPRSARRSATTNSATSGSPTAHVWAPRTPNCSPTTCAHWCSTAASSRRPTPPNSIASRVPGSTSRSRTSPPPAMATRTVSSGSSGRRWRCTPRSSPRSPRSAASPTDDPDRVLTPGELQLGVAAALYSKDAWPFLAEALVHSPTPNRTARCCRCSATVWSGRQPDGTYNNEQEANLFINCADDPNRPDPDEQRARGGRGGRRIGVVRRLPAGQHRLHRHTRRDRPVGVRTGRRRRPDPGDRQLGRPGDAVRLVGRTRRLAVVRRALHGRGRGPHGVPDGGLRGAGRRLVPRGSRHCPTTGDSCSDNETADFFPPPARARST